MSQKLKLAIIAFYKAFPPASGGATVTYNLVKFLAGEKYLIQLSNDKNIRRIDGDINLININHISNNRLYKAVNLVLHFPFIIRKIKQLAPKVVILEGGSWALYYLILFYLIKLFKISSKIVYHAHDVEYLLRKQKNNKLIALITKWAERNIMRKSDIATAVSEIDGQNFEKIYGIKPIILPNGVDIEKFDEVTNEQILKIKNKYNLDGKIVLFMGLPSFKPNKEAIDFLINRIFPHVVENSPDAKLAIIGGKINYEREWLINPGNIPYEEVPVFIKACDVCVAPIFSGSGTRLKILEYMAAGKPVVSTTKGAEGITVTNGKNIIIADTADEFIEKILYLLKYPEIREKLGNEGRKLVKENYSWQNIVRDFEMELFRRYYVCD